MMSFRALHITLACLSVAALPCLLPARAAHAQVSLGGGHGGGGDDSPDAAEAKANAAAAAPPPALPGAVSSDPDEPTTHAALDMNPNAALFDAIDHGSLVAAREALSRGASQQARNVLGQTPIDMSVDLGRNDITFLLLSMRNAEESQGGAGGGAAGGRAGGEVASASVGAQRLRKLSVGAQGPQDKSGAREDAVRQASYSPLALRGGAPKPEVGFLGFSGT